MTWVGSPTPGGWVYTHDSHDARIILDHILPRGNGLEAWVELRAGEVEVPIVAGTQNLMLPKAAQPFADSAQQRRSDLEVDWTGGLVEAFHNTIRTWRAGSDIVDLTDVEATDIRFLVDPLLEEGNTRIIAPGGSGKSLLGLAIALTIATGSRKFLGLTAQEAGPVLYLDWEANKDTHSRRMKALCKGAGVDRPHPGLLYYQSEALPLYRTMQAVRTASEKLGAVALVVDSRQAAAGPSGQTSGEEAASNLHLALREIGRPAVILDHKTKESVAKGRKGGFGSVFNTNWVRMEWEFTRYTRLAANDHLFVLSLEKENNVGDLEPLGFRLQTEGDKRGITSATFHRVKPSSIVDPAADGGLSERILTLFESQTEPMTITRIAEMTGEAPTSIRSALNRDPRFVNVAEGKGKIGYWRPDDEWLDSPRDDGTQHQIEYEPELGNGNGWTPPDDEPY